jgi:uncharacterized protein (TIGR02246 family)
MATTDRSADEARIHALIEERIAAVRTKDLQLLLAHHAPDVVVFDVVAPLSYSGVEAVNERAGEWFALYRTRIDYDVGDLTVTVGSDLAFCSYLYRVRGTTKRHERVDMRVRATVCFRKFGGAWRIVHEHDSVPFDPTTGRAVLAPEA